MLDQRLLREIKDDRAYFVIMIVNGFFHLLWAVFTAFLLAYVINAVFIEKAALSLQIPALIGLFALILSKGTVTFFLQKYFKFAANREKNDLLLGAAADLLKRGPLGSKKESSGGIVSSWVEAADRIEPYYAEYLPQFFSLAVTVPLLLVIAFTQDWISALIMLATGPLLPFFLYLIGMKSREANQDRLHSLSALGDSMMDFLNGVRTLKIYHGVKEYRRLIIKNSELFRVKTMQVLRIAFLSAFVLEFAATISTAIIAVSLGLRLMYGTLDFFTAFFILLITPDYYKAIRGFGAKFHTAMGAKAAADVLCRPSAPGGREAPLATDFPFTRRDSIEIRAKHLSYQYQESKTEALHDVTLHLKPGQTTAVVGKSGAGKSTLAYALLGFIKTKGEIFFNDVKINGFAPEQVRNLIAYIPQKPHIFADTLRNNLRHAKNDASDEELREALKKASLGGFLCRLPDGLDTVLSETGASISVGEAQRLAIARAYLKQCPIVIMDETASGLDEETEHQLRETFTALFKEKTVFLIAHRLETVEAADMIYVLESGLLKEAGSHRELMAAHGVYRALVEVWEVSS